MGSVQFVALVWRWCLGMLRVSLPWIFCRGYMCIIGCIEGRCIEALISHCRWVYGVRWVDFVTEPGMVKALLQEEKVGYIGGNAVVSVKKHSSIAVGIAAHSDCGGNPENDETQKRQLIDALRVVESFEFLIPTVLMFVHVERWWDKVEVVDTRAIAEIRTKKKARTH